MNSSEENKIMNNKEEYTSENSTKVTFCPWNIQSRCPIRPMNNTSSTCKCANASQTSTTQNQLPSFGTLLKSLIISTDCTTYTYEDFLKYSLLMIGSFTVMIYIFPSRLLFLSLLIVLMLISLAYIVIAKFKIANEQYMTKPINNNKLESLRKQLNNIEITTKDGN